MREFRAVRVPARDVTGPVKVETPTESRGWQTVAEVAGFLTVVVLAVGVWTLT